MELQAVIMVNDNKNLQKQLDNDVILHFQNFFYAIHTLYVLASMQNHGKSLEVPKLRPAGQIRFAKGLYVARGHNTDR